MASTAFFTFKLVELSPFLIGKNFWYIVGLRGVAQPGSASALGAEGREFESHRPDQ